MRASSDPIQSRDNPLVKRLRSLQRSPVRNAERAFCVEGVRAVVDAFQTGAVPQLIVLSAGFDMARLPESIAALPTRTLSSRLFADVSDTSTPQGIMAVLPFPEVPPGPAKPPLQVIVDGLRDPGNLGTLLRTCAGAGVTRVHLSRDSVDPFNPKVVRAAMGAHFRVSILPFEPETLGDITASSQIVLPEASAPTPYDQVDMTGPLCILVGSEAAGVSEPLQRLASCAVSIPMATRTESLNTAVAASIIIFEADRQRRNARLG